LLSEGIENIDDNVMSKFMLYVKLNDELKGGEK